MAVFSQDKTTVFARPFGMTLTSLQYTWTLFRWCCSQLCMGFTPLTVLSTFPSLDFILLLLFMNNGLVRWYLPLLVDIDVKISVILQSVEEKK